MPTNVIMPQLGESVVEGTVSRWLKQPGDTITEYEPLLEVSTDKVDSEIPAPANGVLLQILIAEGQTVERGTILAVIGEAGETVNAPSAPATSAHHPEPARVRSLRLPPMGGTNGGSQAGYNGHVTPVVARMAAEHNLDLGQIQGSGRDGRITKKDVEAYLSGQTTTEVDLPPWERPGTGNLFKPTVDYDAAPAAPAVTRPSAPPLSRYRAHRLNPLVAGATGELVPLSNMRRAIAEHMVRSKLQTSPHVTTVFEIDLSAVLKHREANKAAFAKEGVNLTLTAYFVAATVEALKAVPVLNSQWRDDGIFYHHQYHIGMAVALDEGLIVPVIRNAGDLNLLGLARVINDLAQRGRAKQLKADELQGGTFTLTNHGVSGSLFATPIINQPQVGILGIGVMEKRVKVVTDAFGSDSIAIGPCVYASLTFDHRVADGASGDAFLQTFKTRLEGWSG